MSRKQLNPKKRFLILNRDNFTCQYCWLKAGKWVQLQIDHKIPVSKGWDDSLENLITSCFECNIWKWDMDVKKIKHIAEKTKINDKIKEFLNEFFEYWNNNWYWNIDWNSMALLSLYIKIETNIKYERVEDLNIIDSPFHYLEKEELENDAQWWNKCETDINNRLNYILTDKLIDIYIDWDLKNNYTIKKFSYFYNEIIWHKE